MTAGIKVSNIIDEIGHSDFLHAFFSTVSGNIEEHWGSRFPKLMNGLYQGWLSPNDASSALAELADIRSDLAQFASSRIIWDSENRGKHPPWGNDISPDITNLSTYFVTSTGRDLISVLHEALEASRDENVPAEIVDY